MSRVALRKESVDRNNQLYINRTAKAVSLSARRAWIEMSICTTLRCLLVSLSARRAWIEMMVSLTLPLFGAVALRKESVDRNIWVDKTQSPPSVSLSARRAWIEISTYVIRLPCTQGRSPQGERG